MLRRNNWIAVFTLGAMLSGGIVRADEQAVYFPTGSSQLSGKSKADLKRLGKAGGSIKLHGSSDPRGSEEVNARLREERVRSVREFLVSIGVAETQIQSDGGAAGDGPPSTWARLRKVAIETEGAAVASGTSAAEQKRAEAAEQKAAAAEAKRVAAEQARMTADQRKADNEKRKAEADAKKAEAEQKRLAAVAATKKDPTEMSEKTDKEGKHLEKINLVYWKSINHALWIIAKEKGFFEDEGFDVKLEETDEDARILAKNIGSTVGNMKSVGAARDAKILEKTSKHFTAGAVCGFAVHEAMSNKDPIVDIGSMIMLPETMVMKKEVAAAIDKGLGAFKGLRIGQVVYGKGDHEHEFGYSNLLKAHLKKIGLKVGADYEFKSYQDGEAPFRELAAGTLDIAIGLPPADVEFLRKHPGYVRTSYAKFFPFMPCCRQIVTRSQLKNSRDKYVRLLRASIRAHQFTIQHPRETSVIIGKWLKTPPDVIREAIMSTFISLNPDPMRKGVELLQRTNEVITGKRASVAEFIDTSLYRDALFGLAKENDDDASKGYYDTMISRFRANN